MTLLENALEEFKTNIGAPDNGAKYGEEVLPDYRDRRDDNHALTALRLDWELADTPDDPIADEDILDLMTLQMENDIEELIENGDQGSYDSLLRSLHGRLKRGQELVDVKIAAAHIYKQPCPHKESTEYTVYFSLYTEWK